jgi:hypothetical protein
MLIDKESAELAMELVELMLQLSRHAQDAREEVK